MNSEYFIKKIKPYLKSELLMGSSSAMLMKLVGTALFYGITIYLTNKCGASIYGQFAFFVTSTKVVSIVLLFGGDTSLLRLASRQSYTDKKELLLDNLLLGLTTIVGLSFLSVSFYVGWSITDLTETAPDPFLFFIVIICSILLSVLKLYSQLFRGDKKIFLYSFFEFASFLVLTLLLLFLFQFFYASISFESIAVIYTSALLLSAIIAHIVYISRNKYSLFHFLTSIRNVTLRKWWAFSKESSSFLLATSVTMFSFWLTQFVLKIHHGDTEVGIYDVISRIAMMITIPLFAISAILAPQLSEGYVENKSIDHLARILHNGTLLGICLGMPVAIIVFIFPSFFLSLFGPEFTTGQIELKLLISGYMLNVISGPASLVLQMTKHEDVFRDVVIISSVVCIVVCIILIPKLNVLGAVIAYLSFIGTGSLLNVFHLYKKFGVWPISFTELRKSIG